MESAEVARAPCLALIAIDPDESGSTIDAAMGLATTQSGIVLSEETPSRTLFTVGYGGDSIDGLLGRLQAAHVTHVVDVRSSPYSGRRPEFNGPELQSVLRGAGIDYVFLGDELGGRPRDADCYTPDGRVDYTEVRSRDWFRRGLERVRRGVSRDFRLCLLCSEGSPQSCHRTKLVAEALVEAYGLNVVHIDVDGRPVAHAEVMARLVGGQQTFDFADRVRHSVGSYAPDERHR